MNPEILLHPNLPSPLHGLNPRTINGRSWWDKQRKAAYKLHDNHCHACGIHKSKARYRRWLEAHEMYDIDYKAQTMTFTHVVALCQSCHNYIHSGRLTHLWQAGQVSTVKALAILQHGNNLLTENGFSPKEDAMLAVYLIGEGLSLQEASKKAFKTLSDFVDLEWEKWRLILEGKKYLPLFPNYTVYQAYYRMPQSKRPKLIAKEEE